MNLVNCLIDYAHYQTILINLNNLIANHQFLLCYLNVPFNKLIIFSCFHITFHNRLIYLF